MSILVRGIEMPKNGELKIHFATSPNGITITLVEDKDGNALEHNGVVEIKTPHGRIVDIDAVLDGINNADDGLMCGDLIKQTTILEAEE